MTYALHSAQTNSAVPLSTSRSGFQSQPEETRKNLKEPETLHPRSSAKHWTSAPSRLTEKSSPKNLKVPKSSRQTPIYPRTAFTQSRSQSNKIERTRTPKRTNCRPQQGTRRRPTKIHPTPNDQLFLPSRNTTRRSPDPQRLLRRRPALRSAMSSCPEVLRGRSDCLLRRAALPDRWGLP